ncbi:FecR domain-containing protein [Hephaestia mangrovi]|uniref:FecR domain-containing protein n=1 Tax=Hephaestia mangrovi TaxID=2873268 RepID=UPI001CA60B42|nr:FecR domain-containing protein [Hephaestia mangrovi]
MIALLLVAAAAASHTSGDVVRYVIKQGDTSSDLAQRYLVPAHDWHDLLRLANTRDPRAMPAGRAVSIPVAWLRDSRGDANLASYRGTVTITVNGRSTPPRTGMSLGEGAELTTAANSFATLILPDGSRVALPSQSRLKVVELRKLIINGAIRYRFELGRGSVDTHVTPLSDPSGRYIISTPISMTAVRGTEYAVFYDDATHAAGTEVFSGTVAVSPPDGSRPLLVPKAFGATTDADGQSEKTALLPAPDLVDPGKAQHDDLVTLNLTPVPGAVAYHILLATDAGFVDSYREQRSPTPHFEVQGVPDGHQFVRISAVAPSGLEGQRQTYAFTRLLASIHGEAIATTDGYRFKWYGAGQGERHYRLRIFRDAAKGVPIIDDVGLTGNEIAVKRLPPGTYFWQVATVQAGPDGMTENWTDPERLVIAAPDGG